jgi:hypothetical protein
MVTSVKATLHSLGMVSEGNMQVKKNMAADLDAASSEAEPPATPFVPNMG